MNYIGWISPNGELIRCDGYAHVAMAMDIVKKLYPNAAGQADDVLLSRGWMRISRLTYGVDIGLIFFLPQYPSVLNLLAGSELKISLPCLLPQSSSKSI